MSTRGLVLGGGGITGIAWETGLLAGLADAGVDLTAADRVIGTSAGSIVGAQVATGESVHDLYARQLLTPAKLGDGAAPLARIGGGVLVAFALSMLQARGDIERFGRVLGARAVKAAAAGKVPTVEERYEQVRMRLTNLDWPSRDLQITGVDALTGERVVFGPGGKASLEAAVNASCAVPCVYPPIPIDGRDYIDGGAHSGSNADLAAGLSVVVALCPVDRSIGPMRSATQLLEELGVPHLVITPDAASQKAIGKNVLDPAARPPSARAGHAQAASYVDRVRALWG